MPQWIKSSELVAAISLAGNIVDNPRPKGDNGVQLRLLARAVQFLGKDLDTKGNLPHGLRRYNQGCRCRTCKDAKNMDNRVRRNGHAVRHGASGYANFGCRCATCLAGSVEYRHKYEKRRAKDLAERRKVCKHPYGWRIRHAGPKGIVWECPWCYYSKRSKQGDIP